MKRAVSYALMGVVIVAALAIGTLDSGEARTVEEQVQDIASTIRCPACRSFGTWTRRRGSCGSPTRSCARRR